MKKLIIIFLYFLISSEKSFSQCCSPGNPVGGTTNVGILEKKTLRLISFYRHSQSSGYWEGNKKSDFNFIKYANYDYVGTIISYGILKKMTVETELGYYIQKKQVYNFQPEQSIKGHGINNGVFSVKYNLYNNIDKSLEWTTSLGFKFPFTSKYQMINLVELPRDVQSSTHTFGFVGQSFFFKGFDIRRLRFFVINRFEINYPDYKKYKYGNTAIASLFITKQISTSKWTAIAQLRHEYRGKDSFNSLDTSPFSKGTLAKSSGGNLMFICPQINYTLAKVWNISLVADLPLYRNYSGIQLGNSIAFSLYLYRDFGGVCKIAK